MGQPDITDADRKTLESGGNRGAKTNEYVLLADIFDDVVANTDDGAIDVANKCGKILRFERHSDGNTRLLVVWGRNFWHFRHVTILGLKGGKGG